MQAVPISPAVSNSLAWVKPSSVIKTLNVLSALVLIPVSKVGNGLYKFSYCKYLFSIAIFSGVSMALRYINYYFNPDISTVARITSLSTVELVGLGHDLVSLLVPILTTGVTGYFVANITIPAEDILWTFSKTFYIFYILFSLTPCIPYLCIIVPDVDTWYQMLVYFLAQVYPVLVDTASRVSLIIAVDMYTSTFFSMCKANKDNTLITGEIYRTIQAYRTINTSIGPILMGSSSKGVLLLTAISYLLAVGSNPSLIILGTIEFLLLYTLAELSQRCFEELQSLKQVLR